MYEIFIRDIPLPLAPAKIKQHTPSRNKTRTLINEGEVSVLKKQGLKEVSFTALLPNIEYGFANYLDGTFQNAFWYIQLFEALKREKEVFQLKINRVFPNGTVIYDDDIKVTLEDFTTMDDVQEGFDVTVELKFREYRPHITKKCAVTVSSDGTAAEVSTENVRETGNSPAPKKTPKKYTVVSGDTLFKIAKKFYGDGSKFKSIASANSIADPDKIKAGQVLTIPVL